MGVMSSLERSMARSQRAVEGEESESDMAETEATMRFFADSGAPEPRRLTPLEQAQELVYDAREAARPEQRVKLAREALAISADCADAYVVLAEDAAQSTEEVCEYSRLGVAAGERALGKDFFEENAGDFWGLIQTRPYMRARWSLAQSLWALGDRAKAIEHAQDMLRLNPDDNQGVRWVLGCWLLATGRDGQVEELFARYEKRSTFALYGTTLLRFRRSGPSPEAEEALDLARGKNPHVPDYLTGRRRLPNTMPSSIVLGRESEAVHYVVDAIDAWRQTPGALQWLRDHRDPAT